MQKQHIRASYRSPALALALWLSLAAGALPASAQARAKESGSPTATDTVSPDAPLIVLVPGFFNSLIPAGPFRHLMPYFSKSVIEAAASRHAPVVVVDTLAAVADVDTNGDTLVEYLDSAIARFPGRKIVILAHSAGGLYTLRALTKRPDLPIETVVTIGTPYTGAEFVDHLSNKIPVLNDIVNDVDLGSIREFESSKMQGILDSFVVPKGIRWVTIAGELPPCNFITNCGDQKHLSRMLSINQSLMTEPSDGVVTISSALAVNVHLRQSDGAEFPIERWSDLRFPLEHMSQVKAPNSISIPGHSAVAYVLDTQHTLFTEIFDRLYTVVKQPEGAPNAPVEHEPTPPDVP